jgi:hypothetical protein
MLGAALLALIVSPAVQLPTTDRVEITLERTQCFGTCPAYSLRILGDGTVEYIGREYVRIKGTASSRISAAAVQGLIEAANRARFFDLADKYDHIVSPDGSVMSVSDLPTTTTTIRIGDRHKKVVDYVGAPPALVALEREIDRVAHTVRWISVDRPTVEEMVRRGWRASGDDGAQFLQEAVQRGDVETVDTLLLAGANPDPPRVPLLMSARDEAVVKKLVAAGADVNRASLSGQTPLTAAASVGDAERVRILLEAGALATLPDEAGRTPLEIARFGMDRPASPSPFPDDPPRDYARVIQLLRAAGAK